MNQEQIDALLAQKLARAKHAAAQDALLQHKRVWTGVKNLAAEVKTMAQQPKEGSK